MTTTTTTTTATQEEFEGPRYRTVENWYGIVPFSDGPIKYLEIGVFYGSNIISFALSEYGKHSESELHAIDPWIDYSDYSEYKGQQDMIYNTYKKNIHQFGLHDRINEHRGFSADELLKLEDESFDMIYIDGNHEPEYVLQDAVLSFRKLKQGGYLIFDDYGWGECTLGINAFLSAYKKCYTMIHANHNTQVFLRKDKNV